MKKGITCFLGLLILSGCSQPPSELTCDVWEQRRIEVEKIVDSWSEYSKSNLLSTQEKIDAYKVQMDYVAILREMDSVGCKY